MEQNIYTTEKSRFTFWQIIKLWQIIEIHFIAYEDKWMNQYCMTGDHTLHYIK